MSDETYAPQFSLGDRVIKREDMEQLAVGARSICSVWIITKIIIMKDKTRYFLEGSGEQPESNIILENELAMEALDFLTTCLKGVTATLTLNTIGADDERRI